MSLRVVSVVVNKKVTRDQKIMMINLVGLIGEALTFRHLAASLAPEFKDEIEQGIAISKPI